MSLEVSKRGSSIPASSIRKLIPYADEAVKNGKFIYRFNIGQPDIKTPEVFLERIKKFDEKVLAYSPGQGREDYIGVLIRYYKRYGIEVSPRELIVTTAGSEAILMGLTVCLDPGDDILIPEPFYANYAGYTQAASVNIVPIPTYIENGWKLPNRDVLEKIKTSKTKAIMIANPDNPTGKVYAREELQSLVHFAKKHQLFIFSDEVYRELIFDGKEHISIMSFEEVSDQVVLLDSISKRFSACGARIGAFISRNTEIIKAGMRYAQMRLSAPTLEQYMACGSDDLGEEYFQELREEYKKRRDFIIEGLAQMQGVSYNVPSGALYIIASLPVEDAEHFCIWLLSDFSYENQTVMLAPANGFYKTEGRGKNEVRIAYVLNIEQTRKAMAILQMALNEYLKKFAK